MKNHVWRPLFAVIGIIILILLARMVMVPKDFGVHERGYMYGWHRRGNEEDWKKIKVKYQGKEYCRDCHPDKYDSINKTPHRIIQCENCHGPASDAASDHYSDQRSKLTIDRSIACGAIIRWRILQADGQSSRGLIRTSIILILNARPVTTRINRWRA